MQDAKLRAHCWYYNYSRWLCVLHIHTSMYTFSCVSVDLHVCIYAFGICEFVQERSAHLYRGLYSNSSRATPVAVARTERIQKLSWQKLQYWMIARMVAQHKNMVTWRKEDQSLKWLKSAMCKIVDCWVSLSVHQILTLWVDRSGCHTCQHLTARETQNICIWQPRNETHQ